MQEVLLCKLGEIVLKGLNRKAFEDRLAGNLRRRVRRVADCPVSLRQSVIFVEIPDGVDADAVVEEVRRVFGIASICRAAGGGKKL